MKPARRIGPQVGFSLVELMIALVLGLLVIGGATAVFLSNKQSYRSSQSLNQVQENSRIAFELLARDLRQAGLTGCGNIGRVGNILNNGPAKVAASAVPWYANFDNAIQGFDGADTDPAVATGTGSAQRVAGTDSLMLIGATETGVSVKVHTLTNNNITLNETTSPIQAGDFVFVCDPDHAVIAQAVSVTSTPALTLSSGGGTPGNCILGLGFPTNCTTSNAYQFAVNSQIAQLVASDWYIGKNPQSGKSLYRRALVTTAGVPTPTSQEMVRNVTDMQITYHQVSAAGFVVPASITNWAQVDAVNFTLRFESVDKTSTDATPITRQMTSIINLRNRTS